MGRAARLARTDHVRQAVQRLRPEDEVDEGRAADDALALLAGHAAADPDQEFGLAFLQRAELAELGIELVLRLLAHRTGVDENDVGQARILGDLESAFGAQDIRHAPRVVLVHLAAEGLNEEVSRHPGVFPLER